MEFAPTAKLLLPAYRVVLEAANLRKATRPITCSRPWSIFDQTAHHRAPEKPAFRKSRSPRNVEAGGYQKVGPADCAVVSNGGPPRAHNEYFVDETIGRIPRLLHRPLTEMPRSRSSTIASARRGNV